MRPLLLPVGQVLYLFSPLLVSAVLAAIVMRFDWLPSTARPIDGGATFRGARLFGDGKTWRGVLIAVVGCIATVAVQKHVIAEHAGAAALLPYAELDPITFGGALGLAAMLGELPNSFVKRRCGVPRGQTAHGGAAIVFYTWDQVDLLTFTWPLLACWMHPTFTLVSTSIVVALTLHPASSLVGYLVGARSTPR